MRPSAKMDPIICHVCLFSNTAASPRSHLLTALHPRLSNILPYGYHKFSYTTEWSKMYSVYALLWNGSGLRYTREEQAEETKKAIHSCISTTTSFCDDTGRKFPE